MARSTNLAKHVQSLLKQRQKYTAALDAINETLAEITNALSLNGESPSQIAAPSTMGKKKRTRRRFEISGEQMILNFVKNKSNPVGREIEKAWHSEGRSGAAANLISKLVKGKMLKRTPLKDERGSRYSLA